MRVLLSGYTCDPNGGSEAANTWYTALELARAGAEVHLLTRARDRGLVEPGVRKADREGLALTTTYVSDQAPASLLPGQVAVYARYAIFQRRVAGWVRDNPGWEVGHHLSWGSVNHPVGLAGHIRPLVVGPAGGGQPLQHGLERWVDGDLRWNRVRNLGVSRLAAANPFARQIARHADVVLAANEESGRLVARLGARRVLPMLPEGVRQLRAPRESAPAEPLVVWVGRFLPIKAAGLAVVAFRHASQRVPEARMVFVGDGPTLTATKGRSDVRDQQRFLFTGSLPWVQAQDVLSQARVHLFTSVRDSSSAQVLEAAALGVPSVALNLSGLRAFLGRSGCTLVDPYPAGDLPARLGEAVASMLQATPTQWLATSRTVQDFALTMTYAQRARQLLHIYSGL